MINAGSQTKAVGGSKILAIEGKGGKQNVEFLQSMEQKNESLKLRYYTWLSRLFIFFAVFAFLSIRHNHFSVNILLELCRYRFYSCKLENEDGVAINKIVICQKTLSAQIGEEIQIRPLNNEYFIKVPDSQ